MLQQKKQHCPRLDFPPEKAVELIRRLPLAITVQPDFSRTDKHCLKSYAQMLGEENTGALKKGNDADFFVCGRDIPDCKGTDITLFKAEYMVVWKAHKT